MSNLKLCTTCGLLLPLEYFRKVRTDSDKLRSQCNNCLKQIDNKRTEELVPNTPITKNCRICHKQKNIDQFKNRKDSKDGKRSECVDCHKDYFNKRNTSAEYKLKRKEVYKKDINVRLKACISARVKETLKTNKDSKSLELLGINIPKYKEYLQSKFYNHPITGEIMAFDNYGKWHIDHILPLSKFNLQSYSHQKLAFNYLNTQPMWADENKSKKDIVINSALSNLLFKLKNSNYDLKLTRKEWDFLQEDELAILETELIKYYLNCPFPYYNLSLEEQLKEIYTLKKYLLNNSIISNNSIPSVSHCGATLWTYFPHAFNVKANNRLSPEEAFNVKEYVEKAVKYRLQNEGNISTVAILRTIKRSYGVQGVSNFRPSAAFAIYDRYCEYGSAVWDMSGGWGGRYLGAFLCNKVSSYIATEPSAKTYEGLKKLVNSLTRDGFSARILKRGSETYLPDASSLDVCFTSPPYFNTEKYSTEATQSYLKFPTASYWKDDFLRVTIENCEYGLKSGGYLIINLANVPNYPKLEQDFLNIMQYRRFEYVETLEYMLNSRSGSTKFEPIFVFRKL